MAKVMCYNIYECCTGQQIESRFGLELSTTEPECRRDLELVCKNSLALLLRALDPELRHVEMDAEGVVACLNALLPGDEGCFPFVMGTPQYATACHEGLVTARQAVGADCLAEFECKGDAYCGADRKCKAIPKLGEPCSDRCAKGLFCGQNEDGEDVCVAYQEAGQPCTDRYISPSEPLRLCGEDLYCEPPPEPTTPPMPGDTPPNGTCRERKAIGESCSDEVPCKDGICLWGVCGDGRECQDDTYCMGECSETGNACDAHTDCAGYCENDPLDTCDENADCGGVCSESGGFCDQDWDCHIMGGTCQMTSYPCYGEYDCAGGTCSTTGDYCMEDFYCMEGEQCVPNERCVPADPNNSCQLGRCIHSQCVGASKCEHRICAERWSIEDICMIGLEAPDLVFGSEESGDGDGSGQSGYPQLPPGYPYPFYIDAGGF
jgi:hypothetical protein